MIKFTNMRVGVHMIFYLKWNLLKIIYSYCIYEYRTLMNVKIYKIVFFTTIGLECRFYLELWFIFIVDLKKHIGAKRFAAADKGSHPLSVTTTTPI